MVNNHANIMKYMDSLDVVGWQIDGRIGIQEGLDPLQGMTIARIGRTPHGEQEARVPVGRDGQAHMRADETALEAADRANTTGDGSDGDRLPPDEGQHPPTEPHTSIRVRLGVAEPIAEPA